MKQSIQVMTDAVRSILRDRIVSLYLLGSVASGDFTPGWSDIDILCLTDGKAGRQEAQQQLTLRQALAQAHGNRHFRSFEGAFLSFEEFKTGAYTEVICWGTSGQRITNDYTFDAFSLYGLIHDGILLSGRDIRGELILPSHEQLRQAVIRHYEIIRKYALKTDDSLYSCGWLLDIARGIYTLRTGRVIAKTAAGEWALAQGLCPDPDQMIRTLEIRNNPMRYKDDPDTRAWLSTLGDADVLGKEIERSETKGV